MIFGEILKKSKALQRRKTHSIVAILFSFVFGVYANDLTSYDQLIVKGYKDQFYALKGNSPQYICEYDAAFSESWCLENPDSSKGLYLGFKQLLVYSNQSIQSINRIKQRIDWQIPLHNIVKFHINYPVIITFSRQRVLTGYDYFTGMELWSKKTNYLSFYESGLDLWLVSSEGLDRMDPLTSEIMATVSYESPIDYLAGDDMGLFIESKGLVSYVTPIDASVKLVGKQMAIQNRVSDYLLLGDSSKQQLFSYDNMIVSDNVVEQLFTVETPTKTYFAYMSNNHIVFLSPRGNYRYQFESTEKNGKIKYAYKLYQDLHVFFENEYKLWELKQVKKQKSSDLDT